MIKSFTDINQSKKLAKILPIESADMHFINDKNAGCVPYLEITNSTNPWLKGTNISPCWSLGALLKCLSEIKLQVYSPSLFSSEGKWILHFVEYGHGNVCEVCDSDPVDVCVAMIIRLHEHKML